MLKLQILFFKEGEKTVSDKKLPMFFENNLMQEISLAHDVITRNADFRLCDSSKPVLASRKIFA